MRWRAARQGRADTGSTVRRRRVVVLAAATGAITGLLVAGFERVVNEQAFQRLLRLPLAVQAGAPLVGLLLAALTLRWLAGGASPATSDEYIRAFHDQSGRLAPRPVVGRLLASACTLATGSPLGYEGPSIYLGAAVGDAIQHRASRWFSRDEVHALLVAGAAAGVAAIFKAPATGVVFALEVPYQEDLARHLLLPALFSAAASYTVFAAVNGTLPLFANAGRPPFNLADLGGAAALGIVCGFGARGFVALMAVAKRLAAVGRPVVRALCGGLVLAGLVVISRATFHESLLLGPGYRAITWSLEPSRALWLVAALFVLRAAGTAAAVGGGGVGGLFVPLVVQGALAGRVMGNLVGVPGSSLFPVVGVAAFLGAGYRVPLAAVMFVAESTGRPGFVVPGLIAAATAQLAVGRRSLSPYQQARQAGHLERRFTLPVTAALRTDAITTPSDTTLLELHDTHVTQLRMRVVPVVDGDHFVGMIGVRDLLGVDRARWATATVADSVRTDVPTGDTSWTLGRALSALDAADTDHLAIVDGGRYVGIVTTGEILKLDEILSLTDAPPADAG
ncbi:MAG: hypothetical protein JWN46_3339 [Acidimicrobiales bacterium]|nr:hypothetical protein [Acidimicrobiales bacterium]